RGCESSRGHFRWLPRFLEVPELCREPEGIGPWRWLQRAKATVSRRREGAQPGLAVPRRQVAPARLAGPDYKYSLGSLRGRRGERPFFAKARLHEKNSESQENHE